MTELSKPHLALASRIQLSLIAAVARNGVIGADGQLPFRLRSDLLRFKRLTTGHPVIMGRKTHESIGRALPDAETSAEPSRVPEPSQER